VTGFRVCSSDLHLEEAMYGVELPNVGQPFCFKVVRKQAGSSGSSGSSAPVFDTCGLSLVFKDQFLELATHVPPTSSLYGLGESMQHEGLKLRRDGRLVTLWNMDTSSAIEEVNLYGSHPLYLQINEDGSSHGVFLLNSNGMDVILDPGRLTYRVLGGVFDLYFFLGSGPEDVVQQYQQVIGKPAMPPWWALGSHQCRWGYRTLEEVSAVVAGYQSAGIPLEVMWTDIDYMFKFRDFTFDPDRFNVRDLRKFVDRLHANHQRWVPITDCGIPTAPGDMAYDEGMLEDVFIRDAEGGNYLGQVWPGATYYPDFLSSPNITRWWSRQLQRMYQAVPYDGQWIDMNEASNFCEGQICKERNPSGTELERAAKEATTTSTTSSSSSNNPDGSKPGGASDQSYQDILTTTNCILDCLPPPPNDTLAFPPYAINSQGRKSRLGVKTLDVRATHHKGEREYDAHNLYGFAQAQVTAAALKSITGKRPFIISRSTFPGSGHYTGHWSGDNGATWQDLRWSVPSIINSNIWGIPLVGADICGFMGNTTEELCARWTSAGAFYPFSRNHNTLGAAPQEPYRWPSVAAAARKALGLRYQLLPYLYTCHYLAATVGGTVARPLAFHSPADATARDVWLQWMLGEALLISPVLQPDTEKVVAYFPAGTWYSLWDYSQQNGPATATLQAPLGDIPVHVRGGAVVAMQQQENTTHGVRRSPLTLVVALPAAAVGAAVAKASDKVTDEAVSEVAGAENVKKGTPLLTEAVDKVRELNHLQRSGGHVRGEPAAGRKSSPAYVQHPECQQLLKDATAALEGHINKLNPKVGSVVQQREACGVLYLDDGESLEVGGEGSVTAWFAAVATGDGKNGVVMVDGSVKGLKTQSGGDSDEVGIEMVKILGLDIDGQVEVWENNKAVPAANVVGSSNGEVMVVEELSLMLEGKSVLRWRVGEPKMEVIAKAT